MNHLKKFENQKSIHITNVDFSGGNDGINAIYINGDLHKYGDEYHNKIGRWIKGFIDGLKYGGVSFNYEEKDIQDCGEECTNYWSEKTWDMGEPPPDKIEDILKIFLSSKSGKINELLGIGNAFRSMRYEDEMDVSEIFYTLEEKKKAENINREERKGNEKQNIISYTFDFDTREEIKKGRKVTSAWRIITQSIRVEMESFTKIITPGFSDFILYIDNKQMDCSRKLCKDIYQIIDRLYQASKK